MKPRHINRLIIFIVTISVSLASGIARADSYSRMVTFGDSLSDSGRVFDFYQVQSVPPYDLIPSAPYARGNHRFTNGETWAEGVAKALGLETSGHPAKLIPGPGSNYAMGGARGRVAGANYFQSQVDWFKSDNNDVAQSDALYAVYFGGNDVRDALETLEADPSGMTALGIVGTAVTDIKEGIEDLIHAGATNFVVPTIPDLGLTPAVTGKGPLAQHWAGVFSYLFNAQMSAMLGNLAGDNPGTTFHRPDVYSAVYAVVFNPAAYNIANVSSSCINPGVIANATCANPKSYLFWDGIHPTAAGHKLLASSVLAELGN